MHRFLQAVQQEMEAKGWAPEAASAQINFDPEYLLELQAEGQSAGDAAFQVERQYKTRHSLSA